MRFIIDSSIFFTEGVAGQAGGPESGQDQQKGRFMIVITYGEKVTNAFWWVVTSAITLYLFYGIYNTILVVTR